MRCWLLELISSLFYNSKIILNINSQKLVQCNLTQSGQGCFFFFSTTRKRSDFFPHLFIQVVRTRVKREFYQPIGLSKLELKVA